MNRNIALAACMYAVILVFLSTCLNSALTHAGLNKAPESRAKSFVATSITVWVPDNYTTIQDAINNAKDGETILVRAGTYYEHVVVDKPLSLVGENNLNTTIDGNGTRTVVHVMANHFSLSNFTIQNGEAGIWFWRSDNSTLTGNTVSNNQYGIYILGSKNNTFARNIVANNSQYGIYVGDSDGNVISGNNATNNQRGIYLDDSYHNDLTGNTISSNEDSGILLYHSDGNVISGNNANNSQYGIYVGDSDGNVISGNNANNSQYGIYLYYSRDNILTGNTVTNNSYGIHLKSSSNNEVFHNNFIHNTEPSTNIDSASSWDNGAEGNYWSDYTGKDLNYDGIGGTAYFIDENNQDNHPLMAAFQQFNIATENQSYEINAVCNSTISNFRYSYNQQTKTSAIVFKVNGTEGNGFCRISVPHALIEPQLTVRVDGNPPSYFKEVHTNGTRTWLYFVYDPLEHEVAITRISSAKQLLWSQWVIFGLAIIVAVLFSISVNYYRLFKKQKKVIEAYEREVGSFPVSHNERARMRLIKDVVEREEKIERFKKKYGIKIQPASTLEDLKEKLGVQKES